jgi:hypothetical protein
VSDAGFTSEVKTSYRLCRLWLASYTPQGKTVLSGVLTPSSNDHISADARTVRHERAIRGRLLSGSASRRT